MKSKLLYSFFLFLVSCATTHPGHKGKSLEKSQRLPITLSAETIENAKGESFQLIEVTIENTSDKWLRINKSEIIIENPFESGLSVVVGKDLKTWAEAMAMRLKKDEYNKQLLMDSLAVVGSAAVLSGAKDGNKDLVKVGTFALVGTYLWAVVDVLNKSYSTAIQSEKVPENHLYQAFAVPGKMFIRKWILINKPSTLMIKNLVLQIETVENEREVYEVSL